MANLFQYAKGFKKSTTSRTLGELGSIAFIANGINQLVKLQQKTLALNTTLHSTYKEGIKKLDGIPGGITAAMMTGLKARLAGLPIEKQFIRLSQQMKYTGQDQGLLNSTMADLIGQTGQSKESMGRLSTHILRLGQTFGVTSTNLLNALGGLQSRGMFNLGGFGESIDNAVVELGSILNVPQQQNVAFIIQKFLGEGFKSIQLASTYGVEAQIQEIQQNRNVTKNLIEILKATQDRAKSLGGNKNDIRVLEEMGANIYGEGVLESGLALGDTFDRLNSNILGQIEVAAKKKELDNKFGESITALTDTVLDPFRRAGMGVLFAVEWLIVPLADFVNGLKAGKSAIGGTILALILFTKKLAFASVATSKLNEASVATAAGNSLAAYQLNRSAKAFSGFAKVAGLLSKATGWLTLAVTAYELYNAFNSSEEEDSSEALKNIEKNTLVSAEDIRSRDSQGLLISDYWNNTNNLLNDSIMKILGTNEVSLRQTLVLERMEKWMAMTSNGVAKVVNNTKPDLDNAVNAAFGK